MLSVVIKGRPSSYFSSFLAIVRATSRGVMICFESVLIVSRFLSMQMEGESGMLQPVNWDNVVVTSFQKWWKGSECMEIIICRIKCTMSAFVFLFGSHYLLLLSSTITILSSSSPPQRLCFVYLLNCWFALEM